MCDEDHKYEAGRDDALIERIERENGELCENGRHWPCNAKWHCTIDGKKYCKLCAMEHYEKALGKYFYDAGMATIDLSVSDVVTYPDGEAETVIVSMKYDIFRSNNVVINVSDIK